MSRYFAYTRVSTQKQGVKGVSLEEQRAAIERYADRHNLTITEWFEERVTAAKKGRPLFSTILKRLKRGEAEGIVIHKIDRSARNLRDWSDLADLMDLGVAVHFANESLDLKSRGGRLSADIQAIVAADYIRNLREETMKGVRGRLKQGLYPFNAPLGYVSRGGGRVKEIDLVRGPFVRLAFDLYASGRFTLDTLTAEMYRRGLRNSRGHSLGRNDLWRLLNNPFVAGIMVLPSTGETFVGKHAPLIPMRLFKTVQALLAGRRRRSVTTHDFLFRGLFKCDRCGRFLVGEIQKGHTYYRCHGKGCATRSFREERLDEAFREILPPFAPTEEWQRLLFSHLEYVREQEKGDQGQRRASIVARLEGLKSRESRLVDAFLDGTIDKPSMEHRQRALNEERRSLEDSLRTSDQADAELATLLANTFELVFVAQQSYELADSATKREMVLRLSSNRRANGNEVFVEPYFPLSIIAKRVPISHGGLSKDSVRTAKAVAEEAWEAGKEHLRKVREQRERLALEEESKRAPEKTESFPPSGPQPLEARLRAVLERWDQEPPSRGIREEAM
jgi:DNA invertase Pin-like site-specific DNA recombinase